MLRFSGCGKILDQREDLCQIVREQTEGGREGMKGSTLTLPAHCGLPLQNNLLWKLIPMWPYDGREGWDLRVGDGQRVYGKR